MVKEQQNDNFFTLYHFFSLLLQRLNVINEKIVW